MMAMKYHDNKTGFTIVGLSEKDMPPQNDPAWDNDDGTYRVVHGAPLARIPFLQPNGLRLLSLKELLKARIDIFGDIYNNRDAYNVKNHVMYEKLAVSDATVLNLDKGEIKIVHDNPMISTISESSRFVGWRNPYMTERLQKDLTEHQETERRVFADKRYMGDMNDFYREMYHKREYANKTIEAVILEHERNLPFGLGKLEVSEDEYAKMEGLAIPLKSLDDGKVIDPLLRREFFSYLLEGELALLDKYLEGQRKFMPNYGEIPIKLYYTFECPGMELMQMAGMRWRDGSDQSTISLTSFNDTHTKMATAYFRPDPDKVIDVESK